MHVKIAAFSALFLAFLLSLAFCNGPSPLSPGDFMDTTFVYQEDDAARFNDLRHEVMNRNRISNERFMELARDFTLEQYLQLFPDLVDEELDLRVTDWQETSLGWKLGLRGEVDGETVRGHARFLVAAGTGFAPEPDAGDTAVYLGELVLGGTDLSQYIPGLYREAFLRFVASR